jgi:hypothetical protein
VKTTRRATRSPAATASSVVSWKSGKAAKYAATRSLNAARPTIGGCPLMWMVKSVVQRASAASGSWTLMNSSENRRMGARFSSGDIVGPPASGWGQSTR